MFHSCMLDLLFTAVVIFANVELQNYYKVMDTLSFR